MEKYYQIDVSLNNGDSYKRVLKTQKEVSLDDVKQGILKDVFLEIEPGELESVENIDFKEISEDTYKNIIDIQDTIELILASDGFVKRPLIGIN